MRLLLVVDPRRVDFYSYLSGNTNNEFYLLWYEKASQMTFSQDDVPFKFKHIFFWNQFLTPDQLLDNIKPDKIIFFEIIDLRQIALLVACKKKKVTTFYLEHGAAGDKDAAQSLWLDKSLYGKTKFPYLLNRIKSIKDVILAKIFYYSAAKKLTSIQSFWRYSILPFRMLSMLPNRALIYTKFQERNPDFAIVFNKVNYEQFKLYTELDISRALFTGVPFFDQFFSNNLKEEDHIVYIDHPYLEEGFIGWSEAHHKHIAQRLFDFAKHNKKRIIVKLHPRSSKALWDSYNLGSDYFEIVQLGDFNDIYLSSKLILGYASSLINGFLCARKNVVLLGWHPEPQIFGADFSKTGLCHKSLSIDDLENKFQYWVNHNQAILNIDQYNAFIEAFNNPFDGKATERVIQTILEHEVH